MNDVVVSSDEGDNFDGLPISVARALRGNDCPGVYRIICTHNWFEYVGSSVAIMRRLGAHISELKRGRHHCRRLQNLWTKYGESSFRWDIIEAGGDSAWIRAREQARIDSFKSLGFLLNSNMTVLEPPHGPCTPESNEKRSLKLKGIPRPQAVKDLISAAARARGPNAEAINRLKLLASSQQRVMTTTEAADMRERRLAGASVTELAASFGVCGVIWRREFYRHNPDLIGYRPAKQRTRAKR